MGVSKNNGTPKSSILIGFSIINHPFWGTPIFGNTHTWIFQVCKICAFSPEKPTKRQKFYISGRSSNSYFLLFFFSVLVLAGYCSSMGFFVFRNPCRDLLDGIFSDFFSSSNWMQTDESFPRWNFPWKGEFVRKTSVRNSPPETLDFFCVESFRSSMCFLLVGTQMMETFLVVL